MHQLVFDSADACHPCDTCKFHKYNVQFLLSHKIDNKSIALVNRFRIIGSIPRCPCRGSSSSDSRWMGCRRCSASDLLAIHLGEDDVRSDLSAHERARVQLLPQMNPSIPKSRVLLSYASCCNVLAWSSSSLSFWTSSNMTADQALPDSSEVRVVPFLQIGMVGLVGSCCRLLLHQDPNLFVN